MSPSLLGHQHQHTNMSSRLPSSRKASHPHLPFEFSSVLPFCYNKVPKIVCTHYFYHFTKIVLITVINATSTLPNQFSILRGQQHLTLSECTFLPELVFPLGLQDTTLFFLSSLHCLYFLPSHSAPECPTAPAWEAFFYSQIHWSLRVDTSLSPTKSCPESQSQPKLST